MKNEMNRFHRNHYLLKVFLFLMMAAPLALSAQDNNENLSETLNKLIPESGLIVHLGCQKGNLTQHLGDKGKYVIHAMDPEEENIKIAKDVLRKLSVSGLVSTQVSDLKLLPFKNHLATVMIVEDPDRLFKSSQLSVEEIDRIMQPYGIILILAPAVNSSGVNKIVNNPLVTTNYERLQDQSGVICLRKKVPSTMGDWPQFHYDGGRTGVSNDTAFEPPKSLQWLSGPSNYVPMSKSTAPGYQMNHNGVNIYFVGMKNKDNHFPKFAPWANSTIVHPRQHDYKDVVSSGNDFLYALVARNAFNGVKLWRRPHFYHRATVAAAKGILYVLDKGEIHAIDILSGKPLFILGKAPEVDAFYLSDHILLAKSERNVYCFDLEKKMEIWSKSIEKNTHVLIDHQRIMMRTNKLLSAINTANGEVVWSKDNTELQISFNENMSFVKDGILIMSARNKKSFVGVIAMAVDDGKRLWQYEVPRTVWEKFSPFSVSFAGGLILVVHFKHTSDVTRVVGLNPKTGVIVKNFDTGSHKGICGPSISTEKYTFGDRPVRFVNMETGDVHNFTVSRPSCGSGAMVASGMFFSQPIKCFCVKGSLKRHFLALGSEEPFQLEELKEQRLSTFKTAAIEGVKEVGPEKIWSTYRGDADRSGSKPFDTSTSYALEWKSKIPNLNFPANNIGDDWIDFSLGLDAITTPVTDGENIYTAAVHGHKVYAVNGASGKIIWTCHVDGRMEVPPTLYKGLCFVGTSKGMVYAINSKTGEIHWQFRAAPSQRMLMAYGQLESPWPVVGGVLIHKEMAFVLCGRTTEIDNGLWFYALEPQSGKLIWEKNFNKEEKNIPDLLLGSGDTISMGGCYLQLQYLTGQVEGNIYGVVRGYDRGHLIDRSWHCGYEPMWKQGIGFEGVNGRLLVKNEEFVSLYDAPRVLAQPIQHTIKMYTAAAVKEKKPRPLWESEREMNTSVDAIILSKNVLIVAERKLTDVIKLPFAERTMESIKKYPSKLILFNTKNGEVFQSLDLPGPVAADGLALTKDKLIVSLMNGTVLSFKAQ